MSAMVTMMDAKFIRSRQDAFQTNVVTVLGTLLQQKHLYQGLPVRPTDTYLVKSENQANAEERLPAVTQFIRNAWSVDPPPPSGYVPVCFCRPPDIKLFCSACNRVEAYNLVFADDLFRRIEQGAFETKGETDQLFLFAYKCQSCKGTPETFLIRRRGLRLRNEGRSPIEHVEVSTAIPKAVSRFVSGAVVAHQSGQTLAGLFLLRTFIEQWARLATGSQKQQPDQVIEEYMTMLPSDFRGRFPSMRSLYAELSADIHAARGSAELFDQARGQIDQHFDARRLFKLEQPAAHPSAGTGDAAGLPQA
jgi:hypothetical protein